MNILENAQQFIKQGIGIIPIQYRDKRPDFNLINSWECHKTQLPGLQTLYQWFGTGQHNYGVIAGWRGLVILDFDDLTEYKAWWRWAWQTGGLAEQVSRETYRVATGRGVHIYIRLPHPERNRKVGKVDIKGDGYVLGPGSMHPSGVEYRASGEMKFMLVSALSDVLPVTMLAPAANTIPAAAWTVSPKPAGKVPGSLVARIKSAVSVESLLPDVRPSGDHWLMTRCPLHDDHHPSMWVDTKNQICGCFSGCTDKPLDVINLYARIHGISNTEAIYRLGELTR